MEELDRDVADEATRIQNVNLEEFSEKVPLMLHGLVVKYDKKGEKFVAVDNLSFGIVKSECFGLLGKHFVFNNDKFPNFGTRYSK